MEGAWFCDGDGHDVGAGRLVVQRWSDLQVRVFDSADGKWYQGSFLEQLKDICESDFKSSHVTLRGFSRLRGLWTEFSFLDADAYYETDASAAA